VHHECGCGLRRGTLDIDSTPDMNRDCQAQHTAQQAAAHLILAAAHHRQLVARLCDRALLRQVGGCQLPVLDADVLQCGRHL